MGNLKNFVGESAYNIIKNIAVDGEAIRRALVTPQNARAVFSDLTEYEVRAICSEISNSGSMGQIRETTKDEIKEAFNSVGYWVIFDDKDAIIECKKHYHQGEVICTYNNLESRMREYHMLVAVRTDIEKIKRSKNPKRDDDYGTSILNIQIARNGSHMSIKNRYNHTVSQADSTLCNNLDLLYPGLQSMVLGYYGFASLNSSKSHYNHIVNIGGVYLKYHTEKNNIYFGEFVLDGANGARFTDTSRYYVTTGKDGNTSRRNPLVLDFKNKIAIDVTESKKQKQRNGKTPLLSWAMRENIITSANKEQLDTITMVFENATQELLQGNKNALKYLHEAYGYNFTKPYKVTGFLGKFTVNSIKKATNSDTGILLMYTDGKFHPCVMTNGKFEVKDVRRGYNYNIDTFYRQMDFEAARKSGNVATYVIQQEKQYIGKPKPEESRAYNYYRNKADAPEFDKSGNNLTRAREELSNKLRQYKAEKRAKEAAEVDFNQDILEITKSFAELKTVIISRLTAAETAEEYSLFESVLGFRTTWMVRDIEALKKRAANKSFTSVSEAQDMINGIKDKITELKKKLEPNT